MLTERKSKWLNFLDGSILVDPDKEPPLNSTTIVMLMYIHLCTVYGSSVSFFGWSNVSVNCDSPVSNFFSKEF